MKEITAVDDFVKDITTQVPKGKGIAILASSSENQFSLEDPSLQHGVFTYFLCDSFGLKADIDGNQALSLQEIYAYSRPLVVQYVEQNFRAEYRQTSMFVNRIEEEVHLVFPELFDLEQNWRTEEAERLLLFLRQEELERLREQEGKIESLFAKQSFLESGFADAIDNIHEIEEVLV